MSTPVIQAEGLGKRYRRALGSRRNDTLRDALANFARSPLAALRRPQHETFWALQDVSLEVREGEVLGLIGRNGAGKTTLLKILSRITRPTTGWAEIHGRVRSLLEVGTGFHGELSGRENAYLSGSILGMSKNEIDRKFDEIVAFAEIDKFIDTPVKHYSSGMYVRLAFAVAAHLEPEILLVDEVLAVGDINFQKKCLGKMGDVARAGRTVVLVSHQLNQIRRLCHRVIWIDAASVRQDGPTHEVVSGYESAMARGDCNGHQQERAPATKGRFLKWKIAAPPGEEPHTLNNLGPVTVKFVLALSQPVRRGCHGIALFNHDRQLIWASAKDGLDLPAGEHDLCYRFPMLPLRPGPYAWHVSLYDEGVEEVDAWGCLPDMIVATNVHQHPFDHWNGVLNIPSELSIFAKAEPTQ
jgi:ABC-type polysaccharide/polyol phosphate transport system ATPase subunit